MSQHHFFIKHDGQKTHILMGWDRPLQGYFLVINKDTDIDSPYWSNLDCKVSHPKTLEPFIQVLQQANVVLPMEMVKEIELDAEQNTGNRQVIHQVTPDGHKYIEGIDPSQESLDFSFTRYASLTK